MTSRIMLSTILLLALSGCRSPTNPLISSPWVACGTGDAMTQTTLYFGLNRPQGTAINETEWQSFVDEQVTPRFKNGLTVLAAKGQWMGNDGQLARENSKALLLIHAANQTSEQGIEALRALYKQRFAQDAVMRVDNPVCVAF
ncbi:DUF3574 domain-containing protein [Erwinia pyrifoliae]|uniref:DUF3574 domain-containing protein n=1 Tax=Erwinia pyrifoliae TaxID=79967 RepID=A0ABY5X8K4_ERWPY|nr:DUF3574 domain-containing protein [Erwinia pyrifoliae]AUX74305.1 DUF3574 domain-containing protein [Erwinia pyrifoliae]MCA8875338.1 DUF3574 domain-containing protein [Erwinia pyrifoliae]MCT2385367.1 DUF3574 domain-containing protein [Erwinia pyrifoliae]MCU8585408.1 DUF3574 domain-containing protein [Erwinia pyrifoliae]UWS29400.1 DUF3574 domain-containing protein [Erwinia pyrifoliae]